MKLIEFLQVIEKICIDHPDALAMDVIYACDDEGNHFSISHYAPAICNFDKAEGSITSLGDLSGKGLNAIIIN